MMNFSFPTRKLGGSIKRITDRVKDFSNEDVLLTVYGVNNKSGVSLTGKQASKDLSNYIYVSGNQFVYNPYRVNIGSIGLTPKNFKGVVSPAYVVFETKNDLDSEYLLFYLKSATGNNLIRWYGNRGGVRAALRYSDLCKLDIPDLTIEEQEKALIRFKAAQKEIDKLFHELESQNGNINNLRQAILRLAVQGKLVPQDPNDEPASVLLEKTKAEKKQRIKEGKIRKQKPLPPIKPNEIPYELPKSWEWVRFSDVANIASNLVSPSEFLDFPHIAPNNIEKVTGKILEYFSIREDKVHSPKHHFFAGQILYSKIRPNLSKVITVDFNGLCSADMYPIDSFIHAKYLLIYMLSKIYLDMAIKKDTRVAMPKINQNELNLIRVPVPPLVEQKRIVAKVDDLMALCNRLEEKLQQSLTDSDKLMASAVHHLLHRTLPEEQAITDKKQSRTPYKDDAAVICLLLAEMEKLQRPTTEFFIQKHIFAAKHHLNLPINSLFVRKVAGPWSHELKQKVIFAAMKMNWLRWEKSRLVSGPSFEKALSHAAMVLGESAAKITKLVDDLKAFGNNGLERWTTVLKVVQDLKDTQQPITRSNIQREINSWPGKSLKEIFAEESVDHTIKMMLKHNWLPPSAGE